MMFRRPRDFSLASASPKKRAVPLHRVDEARQPREHGGLVAGPGADLQHPGARPQRQRLGHHADDQGLADGLAAGDGQGRILPRPLLEQVRHEQVAGRALDGVQDLRVSHAVGAETEHQLGSMRFADAGFPIRHL